MNKKTVRDDPKKVKNLDLNFQPRPSGNDRNGGVPFFVAAKVPIVEACHLSGSGESSARPPLPSPEYGDVGHLEGNGGHQDTLKAALPVEVIGGIAPPSHTPERCVQGGEAPLPCLIGSKWNKGYRGKLLYCVQNEIRTIIETYGIDRVGFLTLTFPDDVRDLTVAKRRWISLRHRLIKEIGQWLVIVWERHKSGRIHAHLVIATSGDIRSGVRWIKKDGKVRYGGGAGPLLRGIWSTLRQRLPAYGFGRHELLPIRGTAEQMGRYVSKYLAKEIGDNDRGKRMIEYSQKNRSYRTQFSWYNAENYRRRMLLSFVAKQLRADDMVSLCEKVRSGERSGSFWWENRDRLRNGLSLDLMDVRQKSRYYDIQTRILMGQWVKFEGTWYQCQGIHRDPDGVLHLAYGDSPMTQAELWAVACAETSRKEFDCHWLPGVEVCLMKPATSDIGR